jgi:hypothetical protein
MNYNPRYLARAKKAIKILETPVPEGVTIPDNIARLATYAARQLGLNLELPSQSALTPSGVQSPSASPAIDSRATSSAARPEEAKGADSSAKAERKRIARKKVAARRRRKRG